MTALHSLAKLTLQAAHDIGAIDAPEVDEGLIQAVLAQAAENSRAAYESTESNLIQADPIRGSVESGISHVVMEAIKPTLIEKTKEVGEVAHITVIVTGEESEVALASTEMATEFVLAALLEAQGAVQRAIRLSR